MDCTVSSISLPELAALQRDAHGLAWSIPFVLPAWLEVWWDSFGEGYEPCLRVVRDGDEVIGLAPMMGRGATACFMGNTDVCDYQEFVVKPGREPDFFNAWLDAMTKEGVIELDLAHVRPDSLTVNVLADLARERGLAVSLADETVSFEMPLPEDFEGYLGMLDKKQRHEVRRKMRRIGAAGQVTYDVVSDPAAMSGLLDDFFKMFTESRADKADFMTGDMEVFFRKLVDAMAKAGVLRIGVLRLDGRDVASIICFDQDGTRYLYNCGYDPAYTAFSAGQVSKVLAVRDAIDNGFKVFDFLKGHEDYKHHLGGRQVDLARCRIQLVKD